MKKNTYKRRIHDVFIKMIKIARMHSAVEAAGPELYHNIYIFAFLSKTELMLYRIVFKFSVYN